MRKSFAVLTLTLLLFTPVCAQKKTDRENENLVGAVRSVRSQVTDYVDGELQDKGRAKQLDTVAYDANGNEVERTIYDDYGYLVGKEVHTHDAKGSLIQSVLTDPEGVVMERRAYSYNNGNLIQIVSSDGKGNVGLKQVNSYEANGRLREVTYYDPKVARGKTSYKYDLKGNTSEVRFYLANGAKAVAPIGPCLGAHRVTYSYDEKGKPTKVVAYETDGEVKTSWQYSYDANGQIASNISEEHSTHMKYLFTYEYDSHGNWIKRVATVSHKSKLFKVESDDRHTVTSRDITYY